jgi:7,8-dihydropterin-6-yl-methyl-4-(beta-D-ribofuranosyl)aminobenzene 5'-phosphate synthase
MQQRSTTITILADNCAAPGLKAEHGLSFFIEKEDITILFDTACDNTLLYNAGALGVDLSQTELLVLSHGHYDHTGGVAEVLFLAPNANIYLHPAAFQERYSIRNGTAKPTSMPDHARSAIINLPQQQIHRVSKPTMLCSGIGITGPIPRLTSYENPGGPFFLDTTGKQPDPIDDDLSLWIESENGLIIVTGCCHAGLINTIRSIVEHTGEKRIAALIGGFHLSAASTERLEKTVKELKEYDIRQIVPCHCTGKNATEYLAQFLGCPVEAGYAGLKLKCQNPPRV